MEGAGMFWSTDGADAILKLRGVFLDALWDDFWVFRRGKGRDSMHNTTTSVRLGSNKNRTGKQRDIIH